MKSSFRLRNRLLVITGALLVSIGALNVAEAARGGGGSKKPTANCQLPAMPAQLTGTQTIDCEELKMFNLINQYRASNGLPALTMSIKLTMAGDWMARDSAARYYVGHTDSLGRYFDVRLHDFMVPDSAGLGENACAGTLATAQGCVDAWKTSPGHNASMLSPFFTVIGIGRAMGASPGDWYWTTPFSNTIEAGDLF